jgi:Na+/melibiose symporter-like transporter
VCVCVCVCVSHREERGRGEERARGRGSAERSESHTQRLNTCPTKTTQKEHLSMLLHIYCCNFLQQAVVYGMVSFFFEFWVGAWSAKSNPSSTGIELGSCWSSKQRGIG